MLRRTGTGSRIGMARPPPESRTSRRSSLRIRTRLRFTNRIRRPIPRWAPRGAQDIVSPLLLSSASKPSLSPSQQQQQGTETEDERERERERPPRVLVTSAPNRVSMRAINMRIIMSSSTTTACDGQQALDLLLGTLSSQSQAQAGTSSRAASPISPTSPESPDKSATALESQSEPQYFDLISLDNATPVMTGQQAVRKLRSLGRTDFVVGATGNALKSGQKAYLEAGADQVLPKPVMLKDIKAVIQMAPEQRSAASRKPQQLTPPATKTTRPFTQAPYFPLLPHDLEA